MDGKVINLSHSHQTRERERDRERERELGSTVKGETCLGADRKKRCSEVKEVEGWVGVKGRLEVFGLWQWGEP